jgi:hypothetical protein
MRSDHAKLWGGKNGRAISSCPDRGYSVQRYPVRLQIINFETSSPELRLQIRKVVENGYNE